MKQTKEPTRHECDNLAAITEKQERGEKLNFNERNILNILKRKNMPTTYKATIHFRPTLNHIPGPILHKRNKTWKIWDGKQNIAIKDYTCHELYLTLPDKTTVKPTPAMTSEILHGKLKHGQKVRITS